MGILVVAACAVLLAAAVVAVAPVRRPPWSGTSFMVGFLTDELAGQLLGVTLLLGLVVDLLGWPRGGIGTVALVAVLVTAAAYFALLSFGLRARTVVRRALLDARIDGLDDPPSVDAWLRWWRTWLALPIRGSTVRVHRDIAYADDGDRSHRLDVIVPPWPVTDAPVLLYVHGGAWTIGSKRQQSLPMLYELAARGWVCVTCDYRLSPKATWPAHIVDVKHAIAWTRAHVAEFGGSAEFLAIAGTSAGGQLAALAALTPNEAAWQPGFEDVDTTVDACVSIYGVLDMTGDHATAGDQGRALTSLLRRKVMKVSIEDDLATYESSSPLHRITESAPPFLVLHGTKDSLVSVHIARAFVDALRRRSSHPVAYVELPLAQHGFDLLCSPRSSATTTGIASFLEAMVTTAVPRPAS